MYVNVLVKKLKCADVSASVWYSSPSEQASAECGRLVRRWWSMGQFGSFIGLIWSRGHSLVYSVDKSARARRIRPSAKASSASI
jgi:hypothetical protein